MFILVLPLSTCPIQKKDQINGAKIEKGFQENDTWSVNTVLPVVIYDNAAVPVCRLPSLPIPF
jgi:hypothetical protein